MNLWVVVYRADMDATEAGEDMEDELLLRAFKKLETAKREALGYLDDEFKEEGPHTIQWAETTATERLRKWLGRPTTVEGYFEVYEVDVM